MRGFCLRRGLNCYCEDVKRNRGKSGVGLQVVESSSLVSLLFREVISHPYISFFHLLVNDFSVTCLPPFKKNLNDKYRYCCLNYV